MPRMTSRKLWAAAVGALLLVATGVVAWRTGWAPSRVPGPPPHLEALHAAAMNQLCSGRTPAGVGLKGEYFAAEGWRGAPTVARVDGTVDFDAALQWPAGKSAERPRSMRWTGWIKAPVTGVYRFHGSRPEMTIRVGQRAVLDDRRPFLSDRRRDRALRRGRPATRPPRVDRAARCALRASARAAIPAHRDGDTCTAVRPGPSTARARR
jgi:hypothetical protein